MFCRIQCLTAQYIHVSGQGLHPTYQAARLLIEHDVGVQRHEWQGAVRGGKCV